LIDRGSDRRRVPGQVREGEVVGHVQLVARVDVLDEPREVINVDLPHEHPVVVLIDHRANPAQTVVDRRPVLVVAHLGFPR
jgi:hypothetical protein